MTLPSGSGWTASQELRDQDYSPASPFVPVILSSAGQNNSFFTSELTVTNRGTVWRHLMDLHLYGP